MILKRKISQKIEHFFTVQSRKALLITGARQVGKTFIIREYAKRFFKSFVEINFYEDSTARSIFSEPSNVENLLLRISAFSNAPLIPGETLIFLDEVQECPDILTAIKFLVEDGRYRYILSGSLLGVTLKDIRSLPVGYMDIMDMYPLDFEEFSRANGVSEQVIAALEFSYKNCTPVDEIIHEKMLELFQLYLMIGGMPAVVAKYLQSFDLARVIEEQKSIISLYKKDIAKYDQSNKLYLQEILDLISSELSSKNKRFNFKSLNNNFKFERKEDSFIWLWEAGVALPVFNASNPCFPLLMSKNRNLFKLFLCDVGLLVSMCVNGTQLKILSGEQTANFGAIFENVAAQELRANGFNLYYFNSKKQGEVDFLVEKQGEVLPIEIKSGKDYRRHNALNNLLENKEYKIPKALVFDQKNVEKNGKIIYLPIYMLMFLTKEEEAKEIPYKKDFSALQ